MYKLLINMPYIDVKQTIWRRYYIPEEIDNQSDIIKLIDSLEYQDLDSELMFDTEEEMTPIDNDNQSTIEVYDYNGSMIWSNEPVEVKRENSINKIIE